MLSLKRTITGAAIALMVGLSVVAQPVARNIAFAAEPDKQEASNTVNSSIGDLLKSLGIPGEALKSGLGDKEIVEFAEAALKLGGDEALKDPALWVEIGKNGGAKGVEAALSSMVRDALNIPEDVWKGASAAELLDGAGTIQSVGGDTSDKNIWDELGEVKAGNVTPIDFIRNNTTVDLPEQTDTKTSSNNNQPGQTGGGSSQGGDQGSGQAASETRHVDRSEAPDRPLGAGAPGGSGGSGAGATGGNGGPTGAGGTPAGGSAPVDDKAGAASGKGGSSRTPIIDINEVQISQADQPTPADSYTADLPNGRGGSDGREDDNNNGNGNNGNDDNDDDNSGDGEQDSDEDDNSGDGDDNGGGEDDDSGDGEDSGSDDDSGDDDSSDGGDEGDGGDSGDGEADGGEGGDEGDSGDDTTMPGGEGSGDPKQEREWFRAMFPHLAGTPLDPYTKLDELENYDPNDPCGPKANPGPDGDCGGEDREETDTTATHHGITPDCDNEFGCGGPQLTPEQMEEIMKLGDPNNPCGPKANPGPDGGCGEDEPQEEPGLPGIGPDCEVCGTHQLQANAPAMNAGNMMNNKGGQGSIPMGKGGFPGK